MRDQDDWMKWGRENQEKPSLHPLCPDPSMPESEVGLQKVIPTHINTKIPRLPWGSHKALVITLHPDQKDLPSIDVEREQVIKSLSEIGFEVIRLDAHEAEDPRTFRNTLASDHWDILHFIGHMGDKNMIGETGHVSAADFVASCCRSAPPRLVVLNACKSGDMNIHTEVGGISGPIAEQFCLRGVDAVIATRWDIRDDASANFSKSFWESISQRIPKFNPKIDTSLDVAKALLDARNYLKLKHGDMDACWLAYTLFTSRNDGCLIPSNNVIAYPIESSHPPYIELQNHVEVCEYLAPGGAGLYLMAAPECTGKTTTAKLALASFGIDSTSNCFLSLRHNDSLTIIETLHEALNELENAPFHPLVLDDAELLMNHIESGIHKKLLQISKRVPLLLIMRERKEYRQINLAPFQILNFDEDEMKELRPHQPNPAEFQVYLKRHYNEMTLHEVELLLNRMQYKFYNLPRFFEALAKERVDYDLLEYPLDAPLQNRLTSLSNDELLALQLISETVKPIVGAFRAEIAWTYLLREEIVSSPVSIFNTLCLLGIAQEYHSPEQTPTADQINDEFLEKIPEALRENIVHSPDYEQFAKARRLNHHSDYEIPPSIALLYTGYTINNNVMQTVKKLPRHPNLQKAQSVCLAILRTSKLDNIPRLQDVYDSDEMVLKAISEESSTNSNKLNARRLLMAFRLGKEQIKDTLDKELEIWFENPSKLEEAVKFSEPILFEHMSARLPSLRPETLFKLGKFFIKHPSLLRLETRLAGYFLWNLVETGRSEVPKSWVGEMAQFWDKKTWNELQTRFEDSIRETPDWHPKIEIRRLNLKSTYLLKNQTHDDREEELLAASLRALNLKTNEVLDMYLLHLNYCQVLYRHLLLKGKRPILHAFEAHLLASERLIEGNSDENCLLQQRLTEGIPQRIWMHSALTLLKHRIELRGQGDPVQELRWIRDLIEAAHQIGQVCKNLRRACFSEAASRLISLKRRRNLVWTQHLTEIRATFTRIVRNRVWEDRKSGDTLHISAELHIHFIHAYDPHNPLPPIFPNSQQPPPSSKETERKWYEVMEKIQQKVETSIDKPTDMSWVLKHRSASHLEIDKTLGPLTSDASSQVAAILWRGTKHLGPGAADIGAFASTYPEHLNDQERREADKHRFGSKS